MQSAYLLISHGSRDRRPQAAVERIAQLVREKLRSLYFESQVDKTRWTKTANPGLSLLPNFRKFVAPSIPAVRRLEPLVGTATLECAPVPLSQQIKEFGDRVKAPGCTRLQIVPLLLLPGVHVMEDIPSEVAAAQQALGKDLSVDLRPYIGSHPDWESVLAGELSRIKSEARILLAHGSSRSNSTQPVEVMARHLDAATAYWGIPPSLEEQVVELIEAGHRHIAIQPYFLFAGGITDAIADAVAQLQARFPQVQLHLGAPIGEPAKLADMIVDLTQD